VALTLALALVVAGCGGDQNALNPKSRSEHAIAHLWWWVMIGCWIGFGVVCLLLLLGWLRRNREGLPFGGGERVGNALVVILGIALPIVLLSGLFFWSDIVVIRSTAAPTRGSTRLTVHVIGHQWWWEARYPGTKAITANEIHIPVRVPVDVVATTDDVIHSFWIPQLNRKIDLIPGRRNHILLQANERGIYEGECAEFCGLQHAHMIATVIADPRPVFRRWLANTAKPVRAPAKPSEERGRGVFLEQGCAECHRLRGTPADGDVGPDLTHLATRRKLAAGTLVNDYVHLAGWIADPQHFKPGNRMPQVPMSGDDFNALVDYLQSLK
jgi:cytochrome c oxidase subunit 2